MTCRDRRHEDGLVAKWIYMEFLALLVWYESVV